MPFHVYCPQCQMLLAVLDETAGQLMRCPRCNGTFQAVAPPATALPPPGATAPALGSAPNPGNPLAGLGEEVPPGQVLKRSSSDSTQPRGKPTFRLLVAGLVGLGVLLLAGIVGGVLYSRSSRTPHDQPSDWPTTVSAEGRFRVSFPGKPLEKQDQEFTPAGPVTHYQWIYESRDGETYALGYADEPGFVFPGMHELRLRSAAEASLQAFPRHTILNVTHSVWQRLPACDLTAAVEDGVKRFNVVTRAILSERRLYILVVMGPGVRPEEKEAKRFFNSFSITN
jgi:hypothetical protein